MNSVQRGFTAVEVLVTLFIATVLIGGGYQVYGLVNSSSRDARERSVASNYAYESLRRLAASAPAACDASTPEQDLTSQLPSDAALPAPYSMKATYTCPYGDGDTISQLTIRLSYGPTPQKEVVHALYVNNE